MKITVKPNKLEVPFDDIKYGVVFRFAKGMVPCIKTEENGYRLLETGAAFNHYTNDPVVLATAIEVTF